MVFDLKVLSDRLRAAADRSVGMTVTTSANELIVSKDGYGTGRSEAVSFSALFLRNEDVLGQALDRLEKAGKDPASDVLNAAFNAPPAEGRGSI